MAATPNNFQNTWQGLALVCLAGLVYLVDPESIEKLADFSIHLHPDLQHVNGPPPIWDELLYFAHNATVVIGHSYNLHQPQLLNNKQVYLFFILFSYEGLGKDLKCSYCFGEGVFI